MVELNSINDIGHFLREKKIRPSVSRVQIYQYLINEKNHPSVDTLYEALHPNLPTLSRTTVYNTLRLFVESNVVQLIAIEDNEARFDADISDHGHFKCRKCGAVYDFTLQSDLTQNSLDSQFLIEQQHFYYYGLCKDCNQ